MTTEDSQIEQLQESLRKAIKTAESAYSLLNTATDRIQNTDDNPVIDQGVLKAYILDSYLASNSVKNYKEWTQENVPSNVPYNKTTGEMSRLNNDINVLTSEYDNLKKNGGISLPDFTLSKQTLIEFGDEEILRRIGDSKTVKIDEIFSVEGNLTLPFPDYALFNQLANIEFKIKVQKKVQYEILNQLKNQILAENNKWLLREQELNDFFENKLPAVIEKVQGIKADEFEVVQDVHEELEEEIELEDEEDEKDHVDVVTDKVELKEEEVEVNDDIELEEVQDEGHVSEDSDEMLLDG